MDNTISNVVARSGDSGSVWGIYTGINSNGRIVGNGVRGLLKDGAGSVFGIYNLTSGRITLRNNDVVGDASVGSLGLRCTLPVGSAKDNVINGFVTPIQSCTDSGGNAVIP